MARRRSKSWYISRLVRASGIVKDEVINVSSSGSADSDVAAIAQLRREADSDEAQIQKVGTDVARALASIDSDYALFNAKFALLSGLTDSDLSTVASLREDVDSDSAKVQTLSGSVSNAITSTQRDSERDGGHLARVHRIASDAELTTLNTNGGNGARTGLARVGDIAFIAHPFKAYVLTDIQGPLSGYTFTGFVSGYQTGPSSTITFQTIPPGQTVQGTFTSGQQIARASGGQDGRVINQVLANSITTTVGFSGYPNEYSQRQIYARSTPLTTWKPFGFDSDQIIEIINNNSTSGGSVDSDVAAVSALRRDADSDSIRLQQIQAAVDSDYALFNAKIAAFSGLTDSDLSVVAKLRADLDSESVQIRALRRELDSETTNSVTNITQTVYEFTTNAPTTTFSGLDDNSQTLSYSVGKIQVYLNGLLLSEGASRDYTATNGTSIVLTEASDSDDVLTVVKYLGTPDDVLTTRYVYKVTSGSHSAGDSEFTGDDFNGNSLSYTPGKIQVFLNGILLNDSDDYTATNGSSVILTTAPDSDDVLSIFRFLGTQVSGFDSDQVTSIVKETFTNLGNRNILLGGAEKDSDVLGYHIKILGNESNVDSEQNTFNLRNYVERKVCVVNSSATIAYIYYGGFVNEQSGNQYDRTTVFINWTGHQSSGAGTVFGKALHATIQGSTWTSGQAFAGSTQGSLPDFAISHDTTNKRFIVSIGTSTSGWGTADVTIQVGRYQKQIEWLV